MDVIHMPSVHAFCACLLLKRGKNKKISAFTKCKDYKNIRNKNVEISKLKAQIKLKLCRLLQKEEKWITEMCCTIYQ